MIITKAELINKLYSLPELIEAQENAVIITYGAMQEVKAMLVETEDTLMLSGIIDGKNAETRNAQMRAKTAKEREAVRIAENNLSVEKAKLSFLANELAMCRAIAGLLKGEG